MGFDHLPILERLARGVWVRGIRSDAKPIAPILSGQIGFDEDFQGMYVSDMGRIVVKVKVTNQGDLVLRARKLAKHKPRQVEIEAIVDTGATRLYLKPSVIRKLGLKKVDRVRSQTTNGVRTRGVYEPVRLDLMGRHGTFDVVDIDENIPNLMGQIPLEYLDLVGDSKSQQLRPNPAHGEKLMTEEY
jgi:predicted aspartyl protease